jgi:hypothetical protein
MKIATKTVKTQADRKNVHEDSGNAPSAQNTANIKWNETLNFKDIKSFFNYFQGLSHILLAEVSKKTIFVSLQTDLLARW